VAGFEVSTEDPSYNASVSAALVVGFVHAESPERLAAFISKLSAQTSLVDLVTAATETTGLDRVALLRCINDRYGVQGRDRLCSQVPRETV
jgi:hypothetical protein